MAQIIHTSLPVKLLQHQQVTFKLLTGLLLQEARILNHINQALSIKTMHVCQLSS